MRHKGVFVTGVGTGIGKTVAASAIAHLLVKDGYKVGVMKPVQTGAKKVKGNFISEDLNFIKKISRIDTEHHLAVPYSFKAPLSPYHAGLKEGKTASIGKMATAFEKIKEDSDLVVIEGAGGLMVPINEKQYWPDFIKKIDVPILIVTHPYLGMIHHTLSTVLTAEMHGLNIAGIVIVESSNKKHPDIDVEWLESQAKCPVLGVLPYTASVKSGNASGFRKHIEKHLSIKAIKEFLERKNEKKFHKKLELMDKEFVWHPFTQMKEWIADDQLVIDSSQGMKIKTVDGQEFYDGHSSYWVNVHGHSHSGLTRSLVRQAAKLEHSTFLGLSSRPAVELAAKLIEISPEPLKKVFYSDNGSTAVEVGMKMAYQYFRQRKKDPTLKKTKFIALGQAYHGDTIGAVAVGGVDLFHKIFGPLLTDVYFADSPYCYRCPLGKSYPDCALACAAEMEKLVEKHHEEVAAFVIEPMVQGPGGIITAPHGYLKRVREVTKKYDILMLADEVAVGFGRTGKLFACNHEDVLPDMMAISKSMGGGILPIAATLATQEIFDQFLGEPDEQKTFFHGHTFTAHPPACAVALQSIKLYEENKILDSVEEKSQLLSDMLVRFEDIPSVGDIRQCGMIVGIEVVKERSKREPFPASLRAGLAISKEARKRGLIVRPLGDIIVFFPILTASEEDLKNMTDILFESIVSATEGF